MRAADATATAPNDQLPPRRRIASAVPSGIDRLTLVAGPSPMLHGTSPMAR